MMTDDTDSLASAVEDNGTRWSPRSGHPDQTTNEDALSASQVEMQSMVLYDPGALQERLDVVVDTEENHDAPTSKTSPPRQSVHEDSACWLVQYAYDSDDNGLDSRSADERYTSRSKMIALEQLAPRLSAHIWVMKQNPDASVEVFAPNCFDDFVKLVEPYLDRSTGRPHLKRSRKQDKVPNFWVDFQGLTQEELRELCEMLALHELTAEDIMNEDCPEKIEVFDDLQYHYGLLAGQWPDQSRESGWRASHVSCVLLHHWFISVHKEPFVGLDEMMRRVRKDFVLSNSKREELIRNAKKPGAPQLRKMKGLWLFYCLFDILVDAMIPRVTQIWESSNQVDELILQLLGSTEPGMPDGFLANGKDTTTTIGTPHRDGRHESDDGSDT